MAQPTRRRMIAITTGAFAAALAAHPDSALAVTRQMRPAPKPMASPNAPQNENVPAGLDGANIPVRNGGRPIMPATWLEIKSDAQKLLDMITDFKQRVDQTNLSATLPLPLIKEAHNIEKLAKKIQSRLKE